MSLELNPPVVDGEVAIFTLATGEKVRVTIREGGLGLVGFRLNVNMDKTLIVIPQSGNSIDLLTVNSLTAECDAANAIVRERKEGTP